MRTKPEIHHILVHNVNPPTVEIDGPSQSVYVRFSNAKVAKTVPRPCDTMHIAVDFDAKGEVIGIEAVGTTEFSIGHVLGMASVKANETANARYFPAQPVAA